MLLRSLDDISIVLAVSGEKAEPSFSGLGFPCIYFDIYILYNFISIYIYIYKYTLSLSLSLSLSMYIYLMYDR